METCHSRLAVRHLAECWVSLALDPTYAAAQAREALGEHPAPGVTSITGGVINTTFTYDAKGNMTSGNGLTVAYTSYNKTASITRGTTSISFEHDTEHQRFSQMGPSGTTLYLAGSCRCRHRTWR